jgi:hypothetical protein
MIVKYWSTYPFHYEKEKKKVQDDGYISQHL